MVYNRKRSKRPYNKIYSKYRNISGAISRRYIILLFGVVILMTILISNLFYIQIIKNKEYVELLETATSNIVYGQTPPRGRIYDIKGRVIVDNKAVKEIIYNKTGLPSEEEISLAYKIADMIDVPYGNLSKNSLKDFYIVNNNNLVNSYITDEEWEQLDERKITNSDIMKLEKDRIKDSELEQYNALDKEAAYIYYLMNKGYYSDTKVIKRCNVTDLEYAYRAENIDSLNGFNVKLDWDRYYPYGNTFRTILGNVSSSEVGVPLELKEHYEQEGISLDDRVGTSYLEYEYDEILRGTKNKYKVDGDNLILIEEGHRGNDIKLTIDIELQKEIEDILANEIKYSKINERMIYYNRSFAIITEPKSGSILAMAGVQVVKNGDNYDNYDYSAGIVTLPVTVGSAVKGASHKVGYNTGALHIGEVRKESCIKIASTPIKCSWTTLGSLDDIGALKQSSNVYQFYTAINVGKGHYVPNEALTIDTGAFDIYRNTFAEFGLGVSTGIDLPVESLGYKGTNRLPGHLLDFAIGQYDTYTPLQLSQYIDTVANDGIRVKLHLLDSIYEPTSVPLTNMISKVEVVELNKVNTESQYMARVKEGFKAVLSSSGTGANYVDRSYMPAGKTGTSESFIDTNNDGIVDTDTLSNTFVAYAPYDNPKVTFTIVSPDIGYYIGNKTVRSYVNRRISYEVSKKYFEIYQ